MQKSNKKSKKWWLVLPLLIFVFLAALLLVKHFAPDFPARKFLPLIVLIIGGVFVWSGIGLTSKHPTQDEQLQQSTQNKPNQDEEE